MLKVYDWNLEENTIYHEPCSEVKIDRGVGPWGMDDTC